MFTSKDPSKLASTAVVCIQYLCVRKPSTSEWRPRALELSATGLRRHQVLGTNQSDIQHQGHWCSWRVASGGSPGRSSPSLFPTADWKEGVSDHIPYLFCKNRKCPEGEKGLVLGNRIWGRPEGGGCCPRVPGPLHQTPQTGQLRNRRLGSGGWDVRDVGTG